MSERRKAQEEGEMKARIIDLEITPEDLRTRNTALENLAYALSDAVRSIINPIAFEEESEEHEDT